MGRPAPPVGFRETAHGPPQEHPIDSFIVPLISPHPAKKIPSALPLSPSKRPDLSHRTSSFRPSNNIMHFGKGQANCLKQFSTKRGKPRPLHGLDGLGRPSWNASTRAGCRYKIGHSRQWINRNWCDEGLLASLVSNGLPGGAAASADPLRSRPGSGSGMRTSKGDSGRGRHPVNGTSRLLLLEH